MSKSPSPTYTTYSELQRAFDHFNETLFFTAFGKLIPRCIITLQRKKRVLGYYSPTRFIKRDGEQQIDEIAMNPSYFAVQTVEETLATLVHEMAHQYHQHYGKPGRRGYHNKEWGQIMEAVGLIPSNTGEPGGKRVGQQMMHYPIKDGCFEKASKELMTKEFTLSWSDRFPAFLPGKGIVGDNNVISVPPGIVPPSNEPDRSNRIKFRCPTCGDQAWGKPSLHILCGGEACDANRMEPTG